MEIGRLLVCAIVMVVASATPSYAYLDPGTASIVLQSIVAALVAGTATVGIYWSRFKSLFKWRTGRTTSDAEDAKK